MFAWLLICSVIWWLLVLAYFLSEWLRTVDAPVGLRVEELRSNDMADILTYSVSVGPAVSADVVERQLVVVVNGDVKTDAFKTFPASATYLGEVSVKQGDSVVLTLVDVDDAGNRSMPAVVEFVATDTLAPAQPGSFGVTLVGETSEPVADAPVSENVDEPTSGENSDS